MLWKLRERIPNPALEVGEFKDDFLKIQFHTWYLNYLCDYTIPIWVALGIPGLRRLKSIRKRMLYFDFYQHTEAVEENA